MVKNNLSHRVSVYSNLAAKRRTKKDAEARRRAEYLASLPKQPLKRLLYRLHPRCVAQFLFSKRGAYAILKVVGGFFLVLALIIAGLFTYYRKDLDAIRPGEIDKRVQTTVTKYLDRSGQLLWEDKGSGDYKLVVDGNQISDYVKKATIAVEDRDFYNHHGISLAGISRAFLSNSQGNAVQGGSTLTQQLVKQAFFEKSEIEKRGLDGIPRKIKEVILSIEVERMYNKDQILNLYLNEASYGGRRNGVESAARTYFQKPAKDLTLAESALLAGIPNSPGLYNPYNTAGNTALIARQHKVLDSMVEMNYITKAQAAEAKKVAVLDTIKPMADQLADIKAPHFVLMVRDQLEKELGKSTVGKGGLTVTTTLDSTLQGKLEGRMESMFNGKLTNSNCGNTNCATYAGFTNGAAAIEDNKSGQIIALVGSRGFNHAGYGQDNAATAFIQPGSSIKPLVYAQLFQNKGNGKTNYGSGSVLSDSKISFGSWTPQNADGKFQNNINLRQALARSRNIPAIKAMQENERNRRGSTWQTIREMGDSAYCTQGADAQAGLSSAIGSCGTRLVDHVNAIASLARMGTYTPQSTVLKVTNSTGQVLKQYTASTKQVIDQQAAYIVNDILGDSSARANLGGGQDYMPQMNRLKAKTAVKTGTSNSEVNGKVVAKDIWTVGYTPALSMAVWLGNSDTSPLRNGNSLIPAMLLDYTMADATQYYVSQNKASYSDWFSAPSGIQRINNEVYPSYYNKNSNRSSNTMSFDRVSKKKATNCTPESARVDIPVTRSKDSSGKETVSAQDGYDATSNDDTHHCTDSKPSVSVAVSSSGQSATVYYRQGSHPLQQLEVKVGDQLVGTRQVNSDGDTNVSIPSSAGKNFTVTATLTDSVYYSDKNTAHGQRTS